ncbi:HD domain-containing protein [Adhaeribacter swui]|uniref:HD domain-containing protein n=1 Tax=Adhaeribacter swui TaxID=2086471 RepID=A0A7G7GBA9_9BACT|nr:HD domain-containing protein [Adhaeribacter swui]QNF34443.1 HD domain-containing protein [Adhaeribacter swui]
MIYAIYPQIHAFALQKLQAGLSEKYTYHHVAHTLDVLEQCTKIADLEGVVAPEELFLLQVGALYHDMGFLYTYQGHEDKSCEIADVDLTNFGFSKPQKEVVFGLIKATQVPQNPQTKLEEIICDADLDYLGRPDFYAIGEGLYQEFLWQGIVKNELDWNRVQVKFLKNHRYFTPSSIARREKQKQEYLQQVIEKVARLELL